MTSRDLKDLNIKGVESHCRIPKKACNQELWKHLVLRDFSDLFPERNLKSKDDYKSYYYLLLDTALQANSIINRDIEDDRKLVLYTSSGNILAVKYYFSHVKGVNKNSLQFAMTADYDPDVPYESYKEVYDWLHQETQRLYKNLGQEFKWNVHYMENTVSKGNLAGVKWLHENGCPWNEGSVEIAYEFGHFAVFRYLIENGAEVEDTTIDEIGRDPESDFYRYLLVKEIIEEV